MTEAVPKEWAEYAVCELLDDADVSHDQAEEAVGLVNGIISMQKYPEWHDGAEAQAGILKARYGLDYEEVEELMASLYYGSVDKDQEQRVSNLSDFR